MPKSYAERKAEKEAEKKSQEEMKRRQEERVEAWKALPEEARQKAILNKAREHYTWDFSFYEAKDADANFEERRKKYGLAHAIVNLGDNVILAAEVKRVEEGFDERVFGTKGKPFTMVEVLGKARNWAQVVGESILSDSTRERSTWSNPLRSMEEGHKARATAASVKWARSVVEVIEEYVAGKIEEDMRWTDEKVAEIAKASEVAETSARG